MQGIFLLICGQTIMMTYFSVELDFKTSADIIFLYCRVGLDWAHLVCADIKYSV